MGDAPLPGPYERFLTSLREYAMILLDWDGRITHWNAGAEQITGYTAAQTAGRHFGLLHVPDSREIGHPDRQLMAAVANGSYEEEGWYVRADGTRFWAEIVITAIHDDAGGLSGFGAVVGDFTRRKEVAEQAANTIALLDATAHTDFLTGLPNRRALDLVLEREIAIAQLGRPLSVAMIDLDNFKRFNDELGHGHADRYLRRAATAWRSAIRKRRLPRALRRRGVHRRASRAASPRTRSRSSSGCGPRPPTR